MAWEAPAFLHGVGISFNTCIRPSISRTSVRLCFACDSLTPFLLPLSCWLLTSLSRLSTFNRFDADLSTDNEVYDTANGSQQSPPMMTRSFTSATQTSHRKAYYLGFQYVGRTIHHRALFTHKLIEIAFTKMCRRIPQHANSSARPCHLRLSFKFEIQIGEGAGIAYLHTEKISSLFW